jgi:hypothetical protein
MGDEEVIEITATGVDFYNGGEEFKWESCGFTADGTSFTVINKNDDVLTFTLTDGSLKVDFNYKMPAWIIYNREKGKETFYGFWISM